MIKNKERGFALVLALVLLLAMSLMGGALVVTASSDHRGNNSSDEYQQAFYVAETALLEAQKSLMDQTFRRDVLNNSGISSASWGPENVRWIKLFVRDLPNSSGIEPIQKLLPKNVSNDNI